MLYHEREVKNKENASFVHIVYLLAKLCNIFDEAFFIDVSSSFKSFLMICFYFIACCILCHGFNDAITSYDEEGLSYAFVYKNKMNVTYHGQDNLHT